MTAVAKELGIRFPMVSVYRTLTNAQLTTIARASVHAASTGDGVAEARVAWIDKILQARQRTLPQPF